MALRLPHLSSSTKKALILAGLLFLIFDALFFGILTNILNNAVERAGGPTIINKNSRYAFLPGRPKTAMPSIAIVTLFQDDNFGQEMRRLTWNNKQKYAAERGYDIYDANAVPTIKSKIDGMREKSHNFYYWKYVAMLEVLKGGIATGGKSYDWVVWVDCDALFLNHGKRFEDILDERFDVILTTAPPDHPKWGNVVSTGAIIVRNTEFGSNFLEDVLLMSQNHCGEFIIENPEAGTAINGWIQICNPDGSYWLGDQGILQGLFTFKHPEYKCHFKKTWFRACNSEFPWYGPGDLIVHFPGRSLDDRRKLIKAFLKYTNFRNGVVDSKYTDVLDPEDTLTSDLYELESVYADVNPTCDAV